VPGPFYFAWVGDDPVPAFELLTTADLWGGSIQIAGATWGGVLNARGDVLEGDLNVNNLSNTDGLVVDREYLVRGEGIPSSTDGVSVDTFFTYLGGTSGSLSQPPTASATDLALTLTTETGRDQVILATTDGLVNGDVYTIAGGGIPPDATFTFTGAETITTSEEATLTAASTALTIGRVTGRSTVSNLGSTAGLVNGQTYNLFGQGLPANAIGTYDSGSGTIAMTTEATVTRLAGQILITKPASIPDGGEFVPAYIREDESIFELQLTEAEGEFPALSITIRNPGVGLLSVGRKVWGYLSWFNGTDVVPVFHGRLNGVPKELNGQLVQLEFIARPEDYEAQKAALAAAMREPPYYDRVWLVDHESDPDTVLEARSELFYIDRITLQVSTSNILEGEAGIVEITEGTHLYEDLTLSYANAPQRRISVTATVTWDQVAIGDVDLTQELWQAFADAGSITPFPIVSSFSGDGLRSSWPAPRSDIGEGWSIGDGVSVSDASWMRSGRYAVRYTDKPPEAKPQQQKTTTSSSPTTILPTGPASGFGSGNATTFGPGLTTITPTTLTTFGTVSMPSTLTQLQAGYKTYDVLFDLTAFAIRFPVHYEASRSRTETVSFSLEADVQPVIMEPGATDGEILTLSSGFIAQPVDPGGALPLGDVRRNSYFKTDRGRQSFEYLLLLARAKLAARARAVRMTFVTSWATGFQLTARHSVRVLDRRLPGGEATGKVIGLSLTASGKGSMRASITLACTIGYGNAVTAAVGDLTYADDDWDGGEYQASAGAQVPLITGELNYQSFDDFTVIDDDGVDFFNMTPATVLRDLFVLGGPREQRAVIDEQLHRPQPDPIGALKLTPTRVQLELEPVTGGAFQTDFYVLTSKAVFPQTINLEAA
jgi:hypothetical protein